MFDLMSLMGMGKQMMQANPNNPLALALNGGGNGAMEPQSGEKDQNEIMQQNLRRQIISQMMNPQGAQAPTPTPAPQPSMPMMPMGGGMPMSQPRPAMPMPGGAAAPQIQAPTSIGQLLQASMPGEGGMLQRKKPFLGFGF